MNAQPAAAARTSHAAAPSYQRLLTYYRPEILLGLTATPERMDGKNILEYFDNRIAAEIRLPEAIDRKLLCPFQYFGVTDTVDLNTLKWSKGGYDRNELTNIYTYSRGVADRRARMIVHSLLKYVTDIETVKGLGFCVSIDHAEYMSDFFNEHGIKSMYLTKNSSDADRNSAKQRLVSGEIRFIGVVDIYNEGVDIPEVNTVLFLRPTESLTIFLQQLGRGLRLAEGKDCLTVYIHHKELGSRVLLFVREFKKDRISGAAEAYTFLGTANYVKHEGERPMNITWELDAPVPAKYLKKTSKLLVS